MTMLKTRAPPHQMTTHRKRGHTNPMLIRRVLVYALLMAAIGLWRPPSLAGKPAPESPIYFPGQLLVASAEIRDPRFAKAVIYIVKHDSGSAYGIIINKIIGRKKLALLMEGFGLDSKGVAGTLNLHFGGPVNSKGAFILHSSDYKNDKSRPVDGKITFTFDIGVLRAHANGAGPEHLLLALGYAGWGPGQLGDEVARGDWSLTQATKELVFGDSQGDKRGDIWEHLVGSSQVPL